MNKITEERKIKGITLIALVVTIVVLLILAGVSLNLVLGNNGIIKKAKEASLETRAASVQDERDLWMNDRYLAKTSGENPKTMEQILQELQDKGQLTAEEVEQIKNDENNEITIGSKTISFKITDKEISELKVGDYVIYTPDTNIYEIGETITGYGTSTDNTNEIQTFKTQEGNDKLNWRVLSIDESTCKITIISDKPTTDVLFLSGANGYNNGVDVLNDMCASLYSNSEIHAKARSVNEHDILSKYTYNPSTYYDYTTYSQYGSKYNFSIFKNWNSNYIYYPSLYADEDGTTSSGITGNGIQTSEGIRNDDGTANYTKYIGYSSGKLSNVTSTYYNFRLNQYLNNNLGKNTAPTDLFETGNYWWVASRYVFPYSNSSSSYVTWGIRICGPNYTGDTLFAVQSNTFEQDNRVRPVVELPENIQLEYDEYNSNNNTIYWNIK